MVLDYGRKITKNWRVDSIHERFLMKILCCRCLKKPFDDTSKQKDEVLNEELADKRGCFARTAKHPLCLFYL